MQIALPQTSAVKNETMSAYITGKSLSACFILEYYVSNINALFT